jgi:histidine triad (HIT) family protein
MSNEAGCLFCRMARGEIAVEKLHDDAQLFAIADIAPRAPSHLLVIPRAHIASAREIQPEHGALLAAMIMTAEKLAKQAGIAESGYRLAFNVGPDGGQSVYHLHMHVLGGRELGPEG